MWSLSCRVATRIFGVLTIGTANSILPATLPAAAKTSTYEVDEAAVGCRTADGLFRLGELVKSGDQKATMQFGAANCQLLKGKRVYIESSKTMHGSAIFCVRPVGQAICIWTLDRMLIV